MRAEKYGQKHENSCAGCNPKNKPPANIHPLFCHEYRIKECRGFFEVHAKPANRRKSGYKRLFLRDSFKS